MGDFRQSLANLVSQFECWFLDYEFLELFYLAIIVIGRNMIHQFKSTFLSILTSRV